VEQEAAQVQAETEVFVNFLQHLALLATDQDDKVAQLQTLTSLV
jgi:hypothetical protein